MTMLTDREAIKAYYKMYCLLGYEWSGMMAEQLIHSHFFWYIEIPSLTVYSV